MTPLRRRLARLIRRILMLRLLESRWTRLIIRVACRRTLVITLLILSAVAVACVVKLCILLVIIVKF